ncbi:hypothetical protein N0V86_008412 [Didymella sp. IMI 355093]|nr:hypothetical protein N0V86_008412 [Didymella sp. IMI 355093]
MEAVPPTLTDISDFIETQRWREAFQANLTCTNGSWSFTFRIENDFGDNGSANNETDPPITDFKFYPFETDPNIISYGRISWEGNETMTSRDNGKIDYSNFETEVLSKCQPYTASDYPWPFGYTHNLIVKSACFNKTTEFWRYFDQGSITPQFGDINGTLTTCSLQPCVKRYSASNVSANGLSTEVTERILGFRNDTNQAYFDKETWNHSYPIELAWDSYEIMNAQLQYCANGTNDCDYNWQSFALHQLGHWAAKTLTDDDFMAYITADESTFDHNFTLLHERIADEISKLFQSSANPNITNITGTAYDQELYVRARWAWFVLPLLMFSASVVILALTILNSRKRTYLFKNKILAALAFQLDGWDGGEYGADSDWERHSIRLLEESSNNMMAKIHLSTEHEPGLKFKRA